MPKRKAFLLRINPALWTDLETWAQDELRSVNGQIEYLLKQAVLRRTRAEEQDIPPSDPTKPKTPGGPGPE